jgi:hypothetical protein
MEARRTKQFIAEFNFPNPDWNNLPLGFPNINKSDLNKEERHLLDAIILAWIATQGRGKMYALKKSIKASFVSIAIIGLLVLGKNYIQSPEWKFTKQVSAATASATLKNVGTKAYEINSMLESTMSAILKR